MSIMTGTYPWVHRRRTFVRGDAPMETIAMWLKRRGYSTGMFTEEAHLTGGATPSAETMNLEAKQQVVDLRRSRRLMRRLRRKLRDANDTVGLGMLQCIADGHPAAEDQARILKCTVEDIWNARKRRNRAKDEVLAEYTDEGDDEENE